MIDQGSPRRERHPVGIIAATTLTFGVFLRQIINRARIISLGILGLLMVLLGAVIGNSEGAKHAGDALETATHLTVGLGLSIVVPVVALVFAAGVLGDSRDDGTLVYLWLRPMNRLSVAAGAYASALTVVVPLTVVPITVSAALVESSREMVLAALLASLVAAVGYAGIFLLAGTLLRNSIVWGLGYIIIWEGIASSLGRAAARLSIRGYAGSILTDRTGIDVGTFNVSQAWGIAIPVAVAVISIGLTSFRLNNMDVA